MENDVLKIEVAYSEIFKEQAYDLLEDRKNALKLREDKKTGPFLEGKLLQCPTSAETSWMLIGPTWWWKLDKEKRQGHKLKRYWKTNERTNEQTNERASERIEQKFINAILSKTRKIKENPFFWHDNRLFRQFLQNIGNCYQLYSMW